MAWWGKMIGGTVGFMLGGPLGALLGGSLGHRFDARRGRGGGAGFLPGAQERTQAAFFTATFSVMGHLSKADGHVSQHEIQTASHLMDQMQLNPSQRQAAIDLFEQGKQSGFPLDDVLQQFRTECHRRVTLVRMFLEIQVQAALADGRVDAAENRILVHAAEVLGFDSNQVDRLIDFIRGTQRNPAMQQQSLEDAYQVLGVESSASDAEVKTAYRRLMNRHHPDKLVAKGLPEEMMKLATDKTSEIQSAWEQIREHRKPSGSQTA
jgi:DnaJ like chaperone protein